VDSATVRDTEAKLPLNDNEGRPVYTQLPRAIVGSVGWRLM